MGMSVHKIPEGLVFFDTEGVVTPAKWYHTIERVWQHENFL